MRSGTDYYRNWDKLASDLEKQGDEPEGEALKAQQDRVEAANTAARGPEHTNKLIEMNRDLSEGERAWHSEQEKVKGNECFRCVAAVEPGVTVDQVIKVPFPGVIVTIQTKTQLLLRWCVSGFGEVLIGMSPAQRTSLAADRCFCNRSSCCVRRLRSGRKFPGYSSDMLAHSA